MTSFSFPEIFRFHAGFLRSKETAPMVLSICMDGRREIRLKKKTARESWCVFSLHKLVRKRWMVAIKDNQLGFKIDTPGNSHSYHLKSRILSR